MRHSPYGQPCGMTNAAAPYQTAERARRNGRTPLRRGFPRDETPVVTGFSPDRLKAARNRRQMSQKMLGDAIGASAEAVAAWESGEAPVREYTLRLLCYAMGVAADCLLDPPEGQGAGV